MNKVLLTLCCCLPLKHLDLTSAYGYRIHPITKEYRFHNGIDLRARHDTVYAVSCGAASIGYNDFLGLYVIITDGQLKTTYGHLSSFLLNGEKVDSGTPIAITGATGRVTGEHLHISMSFDGASLDPLVFLYQLTNKSNNHE